MLGKSVFYTPLAQKNFPSLYAAKTAVWQGLWEKIFSIFYAQEKCPHNTRSKVGFGNPL